MWSLATSDLTVAWVGSSLSSLKFVLWDQLSEVELSVINREQSPGWSLLAMISIHGVMIDAICSNRLLEALNWRCEGK